MPKKEKETEQQKKATLAYHRYKVEQAKSSLEFHEAKLKELE